MTYRSTTLRTTLFDRPSVLTRSSLFRASRTARRHGTSSTLGRLAARQSAGLAANVGDLSEKAMSQSRKAKELADQAERAAHSAARTAQNAAGRLRDEARRQEWQESLPEGDPRRLGQQAEQRARQEVEGRFRHEAEQRARNAADQAFRSGPGQAASRTYAQTEALRRRYEESRGKRRLASVVALLVPVVVMAIFIWLIWA